MPRRYDKSDLRAEVNSAKMSTDKLRKELGLRKDKIEIKGWKLPYEVLAARGRPKVVEEPKPAKPQWQQTNKFKPKPKPKSTGIQFKKAF
jgi:hypothetical protein